MQPILFDFFYQQTSHPLVQQYFETREKIFIDKWNLKNFHGEEDEYDIQSHILILHREGRCLGGARLFIREGYSSQFLPMEASDFSLKNLLPELDLAHNKYGELSRVVLSEELQTDNYSAQMYKNIAQKGRECAVRYIFAVAPLLQARKSRMVCRSQGIWIEDKIDISIPNREIYEGLRMRLSVVDLTKEYHPQLVSQ